MNLFPKHDLFFHAQVFKTQVLVLEIVISQGPDLKYYFYEAVLSKPLELARNAPEKNTLLDFRKYLAKNLELWTAAGLSVPCCGEIEMAKIVSGDSQMMKHYFHMVKTLQKLLNYF